MPEKTLSDAALAEILALRAARDFWAEMKSANREGCAPRSIVIQTNREYRRVDRRIAEIIAEFREAA
jgi:hypothetical protein